MRLTNLINILFYNFKYFKFKLNIIRIKYCVPLITLVKKKLKSKLKKLKPKLKKLIRTNRKNIKLFLKKHALIKKTTPIFLFALCGISLSYVMITNSYYKITPEKMMFDRQMSDFLVSNKVKFNKTNIDNKQTLFIGKVSFEYSLDKIELRFQQLYKNVKTVDKNNRYLELKLINKDIIERIIILREKALYSIALILDDVGFSAEKLDWFLDLEIPITFAIIPRQKYSGLSLTKILEKNYRYIMHQPMEPLSYPINNPGKFSLYRNSTEKFLRDVFLDNIQTLNYPKGVNNHMGSAYTADLNAMRTFYKYLKENNMFFLNSMTSFSRIPRRLAKEMGVKYIQNDFFIDVKTDLKYVKKQLRFAIRRVKRKGNLVIIGHVHNWNIRVALKELKQEFIDNNIEFVYVEDMI